MRLLPAASILTLALTGCMTAQPVAPSCPPSRNWTAFVNAMPGPGAQPALIVTGEVELVAGQAATLTAGPTDRMMPPGQRFTLSVARVPDARAAAGWQQVRGEIRPSLTAYREVIVGCDGQTIATISPVEVAH